jgi:diacylglycerol kinase (ATP)
MATKKQLKKSIGHLHSLQRKHKKLVTQVEKARRKLEARRLEMRALEAKITKNERRVSASSRGNGRGPLPGKKDLRSARLIFNPKSAARGGPDHSIEVVVATLLRHGIRAKLCLKTSGKAARECARQAARQNEELVIAAGGDGTVEDVASELVMTKTTLGVLPLGTMNNLARSLGIPLGLDEACALIGAGITRHIDIGRIRNGQKKSRYFLETAGLGLGGVALPAGQAAKKGKWRKLPTAIAKFFDLQPAPVEFRLDDGAPIQANAQLVTVSNAPMTGPNFMIAPEAKMDDGLLDVAVYDGMGKAELAGYFMEAANGQRAHDPKVRFYRASRAVIHSNHVMPAVSDKDPIPERQELEVEVVPQALSVIVGEGIGLAIPAVDAPSIQAPAAEDVPMERTTEVG